MCLDSSKYTVCFFESMIFASPEKKITLVQCNCKTRSNITMKHTAPNFEHETERSLKHETVIIDWMFCYFFSAGQALVKSIYFKQKMK